jgi:MFS transporter, UMF1 family
MIGLVLGGVQSSSRALMALLAPKEIHNEAFGFFSLSGKAISIFGPMIFAVIATKMGPRNGVYAVLPFLVIGLVLVLFVREPRVGRRY